MNACNPKEYTIPGFDPRHAELPTQRQPTPLRLAPVGDKTVELAFDGGHLSSDAGLVLLKDIDDQLGLTHALAAVLADSRDARRIHFTSEDLLKQRIFQIAAGYDGGYCFLPCHLYEGLSGRLITTILKAQRFSGAQMLAVLKRVVKRLRHAWPDTWCIFRGDSHFASPEVMAWIEAQPHLSYVTGLTSNAVLQRLAHEVIEQAKRAYACWGRKATRFHSTRYQAGTWSRSRRVVIKVEVSDQGVNTRFVVTDMEQARTQVLYRHIYCARGQMENEIKDHKLYLKSERTSWHRFEANQVRLFLHSAAYVLLDTLRREVLRTTPWACATMATIQLRLLKLGARLQECKERITIALPSSCPVAPVLRRCLTLLGCVRLTPQAL